MIKWFIANEAWLAPLLGQAIGFSAFALSRSAVIWLTWNSIHQVFNVGKASLIQSFSLVILLICVRSIINPVKIHEDPKDG